MVLEPVWSILFTAASHFSLKLQPAIRQAEPTPPKGLSVKGVVKDKAVLSASFAAHFTSWSNSSGKKKKIAVNSKKILPCGFIDKKIESFTFSIIR